MSDLAPSSEPKLANKPRRKRRWLRRSLIGLLLLALVVRIGGQLLLPELAAKGAAKVGLKVSWERLDLSFLGGSIALADVDVEAAGAAGAAASATTAPIAHFDSIALDVDVIALVFGKLRIHRAEIDGLDASVERRADGTIAIGGWTWPVASRPPPPPPPAVAPMPVAAAASSEAASPERTPFDFTLPLVVDLLRLQNVRLHLLDGAVQPPLQSDFSFDLHAIDVGSQRRRARVTLRLAATGVIDRCELELHGMLHGAHGDADVTLAVRGLATDLLRRYAPAVPIAVHAKALELDLAVRGAVDGCDGAALALQGALELDRLELRADGEQQLGVSSHVEVVRLDGRAAEIGLAKLDLRGRFARLATGGLQVGCVELNTKPAAPAGEATAAAPAVANSTTPPPTATPPVSAPPAIAPSASAPPAAAAAPRFLVKIAELRPSIDLAFRDESATPPRAVQLALHDSVVKKFALEPAQIDAPIEVDLRADAGGATLALTGSVLPFATTRRAELDLRFGGLAAWAQELGLDSTWSDGTLEVHVAAEVGSRDAALTASASLQQLRLADAGRELLSIEALRVPTLTSGAAGLAIDRVELVKPRALVARDAAGVTRVAGLSFAGPPAPAASSPPPPSPPSTPSSSPPPSPPPAGAPSRPAFVLGALVVDGATMEWSDAAVEPAVATNVSLDLKIEGVDLAAATAAKVEIAAKVAGALDALRIAGSVTPDPEHLAAELDLAADGIRAGPLASYFVVPPALQVMSDGRLRLHVAASLASVATGGRSASVEVTRLEAHAGNEDREGPPLVALERLAATAPQIERAVGPVVVSELAVAGLKVALPRQSSDPSLKLEPIVFALDVKQRAPLALWSNDPERLPPLSLDVAVAAPGMAREARLGIDASPFATRPLLELSISAKGLTGGGLALLDTALAEKFDASRFTDGAFTSRIRVELDVKRRRPGDIELRDGFGALVTLSDTWLRTSPDADPIAGVESIEAEIANLRPRSGDLHLRSLEIRNVVGRVRRTPTGLNVCGFEIKNAPPATAATSPPPPPTPTTSADAPAPAAPPATTPRPPEIRVDALVVSGVDFAWSDETLKPPFVLPIVDLDIEVRRFTTRAFTEPRPVQFRATMTGGPVELAKRDERSLISGAIASAANAVTMSDRPVVLESRPAWEAIELDGQLTLAPPYTGWTRLDVRALELQVLKPFASSGVQIHDGVVDSSVDVRLRGVDGVAVDSKTTFTWLSLQEPANGPITTYLKLPAPLDTVLFLLRDKDGQQQVPLRFKVEEAGFRRGELTRVATQALLRLIGDAIKSAPMRVVSGALDAVQLSKLPGIDMIPGIDKIPGLRDIPGVGRLFGGAPQPKAEAPPIVIEIAPGATRLPDDARRVLEPLLASMRSDPGIAMTVEHQLGEEDRARLEGIAQPRAEDVEALGTRLRRRRAELGGRHDAVAAEARGAFGMGRAAAAESSSQELRAIDREIAMVERALDDVLALHGERAPRDEERLLRRGLVMFAELRLAELRDIVEATGIPDLAERLDVRPARASPVDGLARSRIVVRTRAVR